MQITSLKVRTSPDFPIRPYETFHVRDYRNHVVETWHHVIAEIGKSRAYHHFDVEGYQDSANI